MLPQMILVKSSRGAGLGDALRVVLAAIAYGAATKRRILVDWSDGSFGPVGSNMFPELFQLQDGLAAGELPVDFWNRRDAHPPVWSGRLGDPVHQLYLEQGWSHWERARTKALLSADLDQDAYPQDVIVLTDFTGLPSHLATDPLSGPFHTILQPSPGIAMEVSRFAAEHFQPRMIGVHLRDTMEPGAAEKARRDSAVLRVIRHLRRRWPDSTVFLATDNRDTEARIRDCVPRLVVRQKLLPAPGLPVHLSDFGPSAAEKTRDAVIDLLLLACCDALVHPSNSSFSVAASMLSSAPADLRFALPPDPLPWPQRLGRRALGMLQPWR
ncbi:nodulation protein NodZ [Cyanobium sp. CH-040]|uniref:nodulation protein NodZ n=1 Tax=Cyanobium sp. CH-040 TaxID=2823708 RepID=UPI0020CDC61F|nr:nodulation protein NodZ [Cyanobium sp. CH-040]MCP9927906.1 hypothetical protein [Cyanobium sp. CH-040]